MNGNEDESQREETDASFPVLPPPSEIQTVHRDYTGPITGRRAKETSDDREEDTPPELNEQVRELEREENAQEIQHQQIPVLEVVTQSNKSDQKAKKNTYPMILRRTPTRVLIHNQKSMAGKKNEGENTMISTSRLSKQMNSHRSSERGRKKLLARERSRGERIREELVEEDMECSLG